jgi:CheY-like chemotaxis protein
MAAVPLLIVLDMSMPVLDGRGFLKRRVKDPALLGIPVVVVSGSDAPASPPMNIKAYLRKPVSMKTIDVDHRVSFVAVLSRSRQPEFGTLAPLAGC